MQKQRSPFACTFGCRAAHLLTSVIVVCLAGCVSEPSSCDRLLECCAEAAPAAADECRRVHAEHATRADAEASCDAVLNAMTASAACQTTVRDPGGLSVVFRSVTALHLFDGPTVDRLHVAFELVNEAGAPLSVTPLHFELETTAGFLVQATPASIIECPTATVLEGGAYACGLDYSLNSDEDGVAFRFSSGGRFIAQPVSISREGCDLEPIAHIDGACGATPVCIDRCLIDDGDTEEELSCLYACAAEEPGCGDCVEMASGTGVCGRVDWCEEEVAAVRCCQGADACALAYQHATECVGGRGGIRGLELIETPETLLDMCAFQACRP